MAEHLELWKKHRPTTFDEVVGQDAAVKLLRNYVKNDKVPHALLFTGPSGTGKSTLAHIVAREMGCKGLDLNVINCASVTAPIDTIRDLERQVKSSPSAQSKCRVWILEELQSWSKAGFAQQAMLLMLEDSSSASRRSYLFACTTNPEKLKETVRGRCGKIVLKAVKADDLLPHLEKLAKREGRTVPEAVLNTIVTNAYGCVREAVNQLNSALAAGSDEDGMLAAIGVVKEKDVAWKLAKALFYERPTWKQVAEIIKEVEDEPENIRHRILAIANTEMLKNTKRSSRAYQIADVFSRNWYDCPESGLTRCCWEIVEGPE